MLARFVLKVAVRLGCLRFLDDLRLCLLVLVGERDPRTS